MSHFTSTAINAVPRLVLASPIHRLMSGRYATLHFTGRKSRQSYHVPVAYRDQPVAGGIVVSTDSDWWRNIADGEPFTVTLRGQRRAATAGRLEQDASVEAVRGLVTIPGYTKAAGIPRVNGEVAEADLVRAATDRVVLAITLGARP